MLTLDYGVTQLGIRLNDASHGQWSEASKQAYLNSARRRTQVRTRSFQGSQSLAVVANAHTYDASPIFKIEGIRLGDNKLTMLPLGSLAVIEENWDAKPAGTPTHFVPMGGGRFRLSPTPDSGAAGIIGTVSATPTAGGTGHAVGDILTIDEGEDASVTVTAVSGGVVTAVELTATTDDQGRTYYARGTGYTTGTGKATTSDGAGTGCTVNITALAKLEIYGPSIGADIGTGQISTVASAPTAGGTGYAVNDLLLVTTGGTRGLVRVTAVSSGVVTAVELVLGGTGYTAAASKVTSGGSGSSCTVEVTAILDGTDVPVTDLSDAAEEAWLLAAEEEAWRARPTMAASPAKRVECRELWREECEQIKVALGIA